MIRYIGQYKRKCRKFKSMVVPDCKGNVCYDGFRREKGDSFGNFQRVCTGRISGNTGENICRQKTDVGKSTKNALSQLPDMQRDVLILRFYHELKIKEIAQITNTVNATVKSRLRQGMEKNEEGFGRGGMVDDTKRKETL